MRGKVGSRSKMWGLRTPDWRDRIPKKCRYARREGGGEKFKECFVHKKKKKKKKKQQKKTKTSDEGGMESHGKHAGAIDKKRRVFGVGLERPASSGGYEMRTENTHERRGFSQKMPEKKKEKRGQRFL